MTIINSIYKGKRYAILLTTILTFYAPVLFAQHIADSALVEVAYGQQPEWRRTSAISSIRGEDLLKTTSASLGNSLQGQLPGLTLLQQSGEPGYDFSIANLYLRGRTSYASGQKMLVYVDGFEAPIESLSTAEIESVTTVERRFGSGFIWYAWCKWCFIGDNQERMRFRSASQYPFTNGNTTTVGRSRSYQCV